MNPEQRELLSDTLTEHKFDTLAPVLRAARSRRRSRTTRQLAVATAIIAALTSVGLNILPNESPVAVVSTSKASPPKLQMETIDDSQLLALLSDQGPVLITDADGSQRLILTRPQ